MIALLIAVMGFAQQAGISLTSVTPANGSSVTVGESFNIAGVVTNSGDVDLTSYKVSYKINEEDAVVYTVTLDEAIAPEATGEFTHTTPVVLNAAGDYAILVTVYEPNGDTEVELTGNTQTINLTATESDPDVVEIALTSVTPEDNATVTAGDVTITGVVTNNGNVALTAYKVSYKVDDAEPVDSTITIDEAVAEEGTHTFTLTVALAASEDPHTIIVTVSEPNGVADSDDTDNSKTIHLTATEPVPAVAITLAVTPTEGNVEVGEEATITGTVTNTGVDALTTYKFSYAVDGGTAVDSTVTGLNVATEGTHQFSFTLAFENAGEHSVVVSVSNPNGDAEFEALSQTVSYTVTAPVAVCGPITSFPYEEGFENGLPECWTVIDADGDGDVWGVLTMPGHESDSCITSRSYDNNSGALTPDNWLITPQITLPTTTNRINFRFYANAQDSSFAAEHYAVYISTTTTDTAAFRLLWEETMDANGGAHRAQGVWGEKNTDLSDYAGQTVYLAIRHFNCSDEFYFNIDDVSVYEVFPYDIAVTKVSFSANSGCGLTTTDMIVTVKNEGTEAISAFSYEYSINEGTPVNVNVTADIASGATYQDTVHGIDVSEEGLYNVSVVATIENDGIESNNTRNGAIAHVAPATIPYNNTFDTEEELRGCNIIDANNDGVAWGIYTLDDETGDMVPAILTANADSLNNDYFVTSCITMTAGTYKMTVDIAGGYEGIDWNTWSYISNYDDISIVYGTAPTVEGLTNHIYDTTEYYGQETLVIEFTVAEAGTYYFGFKVSSVDGYQAYINNLDIREVLAHDVTILDVDFANPTGCDLTSNTVTVTVRNDGIEALESFGLSYAVNEGTPVEVTVTPAEAIVRDSVYTYTFEQAIAVEADGDYDVVVIATLEGDTNTDENEFEASFSRLAPETLPYTLVIDDEDALFGWTIVDANNDGTTWAYAEDYGASYRYNADTSANDWLISSCITIPAGAYKLSFRHAASSSYPERLKVFYGNAPTVEAMTNMIEDYPSVNSNAVAKKNFVVAEDGVYYLGFYCYSAADMLRLSIDSIHIEAIPPYEASISDLTFGTPSGCGIESSTISATITNNGSAPMTAFTAAYKVNDNEPVSQEFTLENALALDSSYVFTFETPMALAEVGEYDVVAYITLAGDENHTNDTVAGTIEKMVPEIELTSIVPADEARMPFAESINIAGTITNNSCALTSYIVTYKVGDGEFVANDTIECNVAEGATHNFTHSVPFTPETIGDYTLTVKVSKPNDYEDDAEDNELTATFTLIGCNPITEFPFEEGFDNGLPECWTTIDADNDGYGWVLGSATDGIYLDGGDLTGAGHDESTDMMVSGSYSNVSGALTPDNWLITPAITLPAGSPASVSFFAAAQDASYPEEHYGVYVSTTTTDPAAFTLIWDETMDENGGNHRAQGTWGEKHADLSNYAGQTIYIGFRHYGCTDQFIFLLDDITVALVSAAEENIAEAIAVYPNPTSSMVTIANAEGKDIIVINSLGQIVASIENAAANQTIDVSNFANGTYFVKVDAEVVKLNVVK